MIQKPLTAESSGAARDYRRLIHIISGLILFFLVLAGIWHIYDHYCTSVRTTDLRQQIYVTALAEHADRALGEVVQVLDNANNSLLVQGGHQRLSEKAVYEILKPHTLRSPQISSIYLVDATGKLKAVSLGHPFKPIYLNDRDYFIYHRDNLSPDPYYSRSYKSRYDDVWRFSISRRINRPDGTFDGLIAISLQVSYFEQFFLSLHPIATERISLIRMDGYPQVSLPSQDSIYDLDLKNTELFTRYLPARQSGNYKGRIFLADQQIRQITYRKLKNSPLVATISVEPDAALADWRRHLFKVVAILLISMSTITLLTVWLSKQIGKYHSELKQTVEERTRELSSVLNQWQTTFNALSDSVCLFDMEQRFLRCNQASLKIFKRNQDDIIGRHCWEVVHASEQPVDNCPFKQAWETGKTVRQMFFEDGAWLCITVDPLFDEAGEPAGAIHIVRDETERVNNEQSQRKLLSMLEAVQNELYLFNPENFHFEYVNSSALDNLGYSMEQLSRMTPADLKTNYSIDDLKKLITPLLFGDTLLIRFQSVHKRADNSTYPVEVNLQMVGTPGERRCLSVVHDITERKQAEGRLLEALKNAENFRTALDYVNAYIFIKDKDSRYSYLNKHCVEQFNGGISDMAGSSDSQFFSQNQAEQNRQEDLQVLAGRQITKELTVTQADGSKRTYLVLKTPFYRDHTKREITSILGIATDITEMKKAEESLREIQSIMLQNEKMASIG